VSTGNLLPYAKVWCNYLYCFTSWHYWYSKSSFNPVFFGSAYSLQEFFNPPFFGSAYSLQALLTRYSSVRHRFSRSRSDIFGWVRAFINLLFRDFFKILCPCVFFLAIEQLIICSACFKYYYCSVLFFFS